MIKKHQRAELLTKANAEAMQLLKKYRTVSTGVLRAIYVKYGLLPFNSEG